MTESSSDAASEPIAVIGLGLMGGTIARRMLATGQAVRGFDPNTVARSALEAAGGTGHPSASAATDGVRLIVVVVHDERQVDEVLFGTGTSDSGVSAQQVPGRAIWLASTVSPAFAAAVGSRLAALGISYVDGPVSGGPARAERGELSIFAGGEADAIETMRPLMQRCAAHIFPAGSAGAGSAMKLINQILTAAHIALTAEALALAERAGIDPDLLIDAIDHSAGASRQFEVRAPRMASGDHTPTATVRTFLKDLDFAVKMAESLDVPAPMTRSAHGVFARAGGAGLLDESDTRLVDAYRAGLPDTLGTGS